jgi:SNF2 family DNA or RNA helicase
LPAADWISKRAEVKLARKAPPQSLFLLHGQPHPRQAIIGTCSFTTEGLGMTPSERMSLVQATDTDAESSVFAEWFGSNWNDLKADPGAKTYFVRILEDMASQRAPSLIYFQILYQMFKHLGDELDEERIIKSATGIRDTVVWKKLYRFQRDGVTGAIDKLETIGGGIIADSVGLGKTFEALAVIKYYELRNDRALVLCPKRLRDNWTLYKSNDRRNALASDRFNYDVLNHTDLSRDGGLSGDIDMSHINWGNYDLVVIDESHDFRNKPTHKDRDSRYDLLIKRIIQSGVKTKVAW